jgi:ribosomal protein S27AE
MTVLIIMVVLFICALVWFRVKNQQKTTTDIVNCNNCGGKRTLAENRKNWARYECPNCHSFGFLFKNRNIEESPFG